tara:strand:+ start:78 stop:338 length:261 start_codon:yes stop_codon:yes gene_type:complete
MMVGIIGTAAQLAGRKVNMSKDKEQFKNIFNSPMDLRHWAVTLIGYLGDSRTNTLPNTDKVDELIAKFVADYNYFYEKLHLQGEEE